MKIPFIDLKSQLARVEVEIQKRFKRIMNNSEFIMGPDIRELEEILANYIGVKHCIALSSGTDALLMALMALNVGPGDEVIVPDFSFFGTAEVVEFLGAKSVFCDIDLETLNLSVESLEKNITKKTKVIMPVSLFGQCAEFDEINAIAQRENIYVIEDGAQSFGAEYKGKKSLSLTEIGCTSFFPSKPLGCFGDGGACFTNNDHLAKVLQELRVHGQEKRYYHTRIGLNARMDTIQAAVLIEKMKIFDSEVDQRQIVADRYNKCLSSYVKVPKILNYNKSVYAQYTVQVENRENVIARLNELQIPTSVHYPLTLSKQPILSKNTSRKTYNPNAELAAQRVLSLPMHPYLTENDQNVIVDAFLKAVKK